MTQDQTNTEITIAEQTKKFLVKSMYGFQTILTYGLGQRLGIYEYLYEKSDIGHALTFPIELRSEAPKNS